MKNSLILPSHVNPDNRKKTPLFWWRRRKSSIWPYMRNTRWGIYLYLMFCATEMRRKYNAVQLVSRVQIDLARLQISHAVQRNLSAKKHPFSAWDVNIQDAWSCRECDKAWSYADGTRACGEEQYKSSVEFSTWATNLVVRSRGAWAVRQWLSKGKLLAS